MALGRFEVASGGGVGQNDYPFLGLAHDGNVYIIRKVPADQGPFANGEVRSLEHGFTARLRCYGELSSGRGSVGKAGWRESFSSRTRGMTVPNFVPPPDMKFPLFGDLALERAAGRARDTVLSIKRTGIVFAQRKLARRACIVTADVAARS
jgi:hypothetical protein